MNKYFKPLLILALLSPLHLAWNKDKMKAAAKDMAGGAANEKKVSVGKECGNQETLAKVEKNVGSLKTKLAKWGVGVDDTGKGYCGYEMTSGKKVKKLDGEQTEDSVIKEATKFFKG